MSELQKKHCVPCEDKTIKPLTSEEIKPLFAQLQKGWRIIDDKKIEKTLIFINFKAALAFMNEVGDIAEFEAHHPDMNLHNYNKVTFSLSTHSIGGLTENDFIVAAKIDAVESVT